MTDKESLTHEIEDDLAARNRNWNKVDRNTNNIADNTTNIDNHMLKTADDDVHGLANAVIVESGSNANGYYVKWGNGLMICIGRRDYNFSELVVDEVTSFEIEFPEPFIQAPGSIIDSLRVNNSLRARGYTGNVSASTNTGFTYDIALDADTLRSSGSVDYTAIGFWK